VSIQELLVVFMLLFSMGALGDNLLDNVWAQGEQDSLQYNAFVSN
jgi:hypothetical protein